MFPKKSSTPVIVHDTRENMSISNEFVLKIESACACNNDVDHDPILQITDTLTKFRKFTLNSCENVHTQVTLQASDSNGNYATIKITSQLNDTSGNLKTGTFAKLQQFQILRNSYETNLPDCSVTLCTSLK